MPHVAFRCPDPAVPDEVPVSQCVEHAEHLWRRCPWNKALLEAMIEKPDERLSVTRLQQCPRQVQLKRRYPYTLDPKVEFLKLRGTIWHSGLEQLFGEDKEVELTREFQGYELRGKIDRIDGGAIVDWKTKNYLRKGGRNKDGETSKPFEPPEDHIMQVSVYAWLAAPHVGDIPYGELMYITMTEVQRWVIPILPVAEIEQFLETRLPILVQAYDISSPLLEPLENRDAKGKKQNWKCRSCPVLQICRET